MKVVLNSDRIGESMIFGGIYDITRNKQYWADNVGITPLIVKQSTYKNYSFDVSFNSKAILGDH